MRAIEIAQIRLYGSAPCVSSDDKITAVRIKVLINRNMPRSRVQTGDNDF